MAHEIQYTESFKRDAVQLFWLSNKSIEQIEEHLRIPSGSLTQWEDELRGGHPKYLPTVLSDRSSTGNISDSEAE